MTEEEKTIQKLQQDDLIRENQERIDPSPDEAATIDAVEPWLPIETKMVVSSLIGGAIALIVLAVIVHIFILGGQ
jgi:hypothetical protein